MTLRSRFLFLLPALLPILLWTGCGGSVPSPKTEFMEIRPVLPDDPLAARFATDGGEEVRLGDRVTGGTGVTRSQVKEAKDGSWNLLLTLTGPDESRWRRFARSTRDAALVINGRVRTIFTTEVPGEATVGGSVTITIPGVAATEEEARQLDDALLAQRKPASAPATP
jgi:hypothetical protein